MHFEPKTILSLIDRSAMSATVLNWTRLFAVTYGSDVQVLHVMWAPPPRLVTTPEGEELMQEFEQLREELRRSVRTQVDETLPPGTHFEIAIGVGHPVRAVLDTIARMRPDLVILGSHGDDGMARSLMGSVAENVVREAIIPTLVVKSSERIARQERLGSVICPVDMTRSAADFLSTAATLARRFESHIDVIRVVPEGAPTVESENAALEDWLPRITQRLCPTTASVHVGDVAEQIVLFARQHASDIIVIGTEPRRFLDFSILGRTTERVLRHGPCSVLLLRPELPSN
jgi:nucleotide-binding universal stress UspA family protein